MTDHRLRIVTSGSAWRADNPHRDTVDPSGDLATAERVSDQVPAKAAAVGGGSGIAAGLLTWAATAPPVAAGFLAVTVAAATGIWSGVRWRRTADLRVADARDKVDAVDDTLGTGTIGRGDYGHSAVRDIADQAVSAALTITASETFTHGSLGDPDTVTEDLRYALWECLHGCVDLDARALEWVRASNLADTDESSDLVEQVRPDLEKDFDFLQQTADRLRETADECIELDARLVEPAVDSHLTSALTPVAPTVDQSATDRLLARARAAREVIDAGGSRPD